MPPLFYVKTATQSVAVFLFKKICEIQHKVVALKGNLWYHLPVLFFLISIETIFKYSDLA